MRTCFKVQLVRLTLSLVSSRVRVVDRASLVPSSFPWWWWPLRVWALRRWPLALGLCPALGLSAALTLKRLSSCFAWGPRELGGVLSFTAGAEGVHADKDRVHVRRGPCGRDSLCGGGWLNGGGGCSFLRGSSESDCGRLHQEGGLCPQGTKSRLL